MKTRIHGFDKEVLFKEIASKLDVKVHRCCRELRLDIPKNAGEGSMVWFEFHDGLALFLLNAKFKKDWVWEIHHKDESPLYINFSVKGSVKWNLPSLKKAKNMDPFETFIVAQPGGGSPIIRFKGKEEILFSSIRIARKQYLEYLNYPLENMPEALHQIFTSPAIAKSYYYQSKFSLGIAALIQEILRKNGEGLHHAIHVEGKAKEMLSLHVRRITAQIHLDEHYASFEQSDLEIIQTARKILVENLQKAPTIEQLAKKTGINQQKLKVGFKLVFDTTINSYLREERLQKAKTLLMKGKLSIAEIAAAVGYENPGYFSKLFQQKFGVLPRIYATIVRRSFHQR